MCLGVPGKIIEINGDTAIVDYEIEKREAKLLDNSFKVGDYILVQAKIAVMKIPENEAIEALKLYKESQDF